MTITSTIFASLIYVAATAVFVFGTACLVFLASYVVVFVFREVLSARGILGDFLAWRKQLKIHPGTIPKDGEGERN